MNLVVPNTLQSSYTRRSNVIDENISLDVEVDEIVEIFKET